jgi:hypothetical protein
MTWVEAVLLLDTEREEAIVGSQIAKMEIIERSGVVEGLRGNRQEGMA